MGSEKSAKLFKVWGIPLHRSNSGLCSDMSRIILLLIILASLPRAYAATDDNLTVCFNNWPPYTRMTDAGATGISVEVVERAASQLNRVVRFVEREWEECLEKVKQGEFDALLDAAKRDAYLQGPASFSLYSDTFWVSNSRDISRYDQLRGGRVGLVTGYNYNDRLMAQIEDLDMQVIRGKDDPSNVRDLAVGKFDAIIADLASTFVYSRDNALEVHPILPPFSYDRLYLSFNRERGETQREFDRVIGQLLENGAVDEIYERQIGTPFSSFVAE